MTTGPATVTTAPASDPPASAYSPGSPPDWRPWACPFPASPTGC